MEFGVVYTQINYIQNIGEKKGCFLFLSERKILDIVLLTEVILFE